MRSRHESNGSFLAEGQVNVSRNVLSYWNKGEGKIIYGGITCDLSSSVSPVTRRKCLLFKFLQTIVKLTFVCVIHKQPH